MEKTGVQEPLAEETQKIRPERAVETKARRSAIHTYVERVSSLAPDTDEDLIIEEYKELTPRERADVLYEKLMAYTGAKETFKKEQREKHKGPFPERDVTLVDGTKAHVIETPITIHPAGDQREEEFDPDPYLLTEIKVLWGDQKTQETFEEVYTTARLEDRDFRHSQKGEQWHMINRQIEHSREKFEEETRKLFLQLETRPDHVSAIRGKTQALARRLLSLQRQRESIIGLAGLPHTPEHTDIAAEIMHEQLEVYHQQAKEGFVWLPSRDDIHMKIIAGVQNARWPRLVGEAGTGKSEQADAAAVALTGRQPTHIQGAENVGYKQMIADKELDPQTRGSYEAYGAVMQAFTGYDDSRQDRPRHTTGRIVRLDEAGRLGSQGYALIKEVRQKRPASRDERARFDQGEEIDADKLLHGKPVLPGASSIWTDNPAGSRYPDRREPDAAMRRELARIKVDYPPMTVENPELYEFMLATLMEDTGYIPVARAELAPAYERIEVPEGSEERLEDGRRILARKKLVEDPADRRHGELYRLSFAVRALQDAFNYGNVSDSSEIPQDAMRYTIDQNGKAVIQTNGGEVLTLSNSTITLGEIKSWMQGFHERKLKDIESYQVNTLTEWIQEKLRAFLEQTDAEDKEKIRALFEHFHLFDAPADLSSEKPMTPKEIGYLSPRVPQPLEVEAPKIEEKAPEPKEADSSSKEVKENEDFEVMLEDGSPIRVSPIAITLTIPNPR